MAPDDIAIRVTDLSKRYDIFDSPSDWLKQFILPFFQIAPKRYSRDFWALKNASFEVKKGETVGIIGRNGSGKSTILQMICGTLSPTNGKIQINGRVAALLELGAGFNPEFTGRENVYLNGVVLGLNKDQIDKRFDDIIAFSEIKEFIDQPVRTYSSGMTIRLAFSVIAHVNADILVIDEALAVGDAFFQQKCMRFLHNFQNNGGTILFVSHDSGAVLSLCDRAILLVAGAVVYAGEAEQATKLFLEEMYSDPARCLYPDDGLAKPDDSEFFHAAEVDTTQTDEKVFQGMLHQKTEYMVSGFRASAKHFGNGAATVTDAGFFEKKYHKLSELTGGQRVRFFIRADIHNPVKHPAFGLMIKNSLGEYVFAEGTDVHFRKYNLSFGEGDQATAIFTFTMPHLNRGTYMINVAFAEGEGDFHVQHSWLHDAIQLDVTNSRLRQGYCGMDDMKMSIEVLSSEQIQCQ